jgi:hypothetical protein
MKFNKFIILLFSIFLVTAACNSEASKKAEKEKADSLEHQTQKAADSAQKALDDYINSVDDSPITNDSLPVKPAK